jgi:seryl-tRNA synthetase
MSSRKIMKKIYYLEDINDKILDIKYSQYYLMPTEEHVNPELKRFGFILEDIEDILPESIIRYSEA